MRIAIVGGIGRLGPQYRRAASCFGHDVQIFNTFEPGLSGRLGKFEALLLCTGQLSHCARIHALKAARAGNITVRQIRSCGVCALKACLRDLKPPIDTIPPLAEKLSVARV